MGEDRKQSELELEMKRAKEREEAEKQRIKEDEQRKKNDFLKQQNEEKVTRKEEVLKAKQELEVLEEKEHQKDKTKAIAQPQNQSKIAEENFSSVVDVNIIDKADDIDAEMAAKIKHEEQMKRQEEFLAKMQ